MPVGEFMTFLANGLEVVKVFFVLADVRQMMNGIHFVVLTPFANAVAAILDGATLFGPFPALKV